MILCSLSCQVVETVTKKFFVPRSCFQNGGQCFFKEDNDDDDFYIPYGSEFKRTETQFDKATLRGEACVVTRGTNKMIHSVYFEQNSEFEEFCPNNGEILDLIISGVPQSKLRCDPEQEAFRKARSEQALKNVFMEEHKTSLVFFGSTAEGVNFDPVQENMTALDGWLRHPNLNGMPTGDKLSKLQCYLGQIAKLPNRVGQFDVDAAPFVADRPTVVTREARIWLKLMLDFPAKLEDRRVSKSCRFQFGILDERYVQVIRRAVQEQGALAPKSECLGITKPKVCDRIQKRWMKVEEELRADPGIFRLLCQHQFRSVDSLKDPGLDKNPKVLGECFHMKQPDATDVAASLVDWPDLDNSNLPSIAVKLMGMFRVDLISAASIAPDIEQFSLSHDIIEPASFFPLMDHHYKTTKGSSEQRLKQAFQETQKEIKLVMDQSFFFDMQSAVDVLRYQREKNIKNLELAKAIVSFRPLFFDDQEEVDEIVTQLKDKFDISAESVDIESFQRTLRHEAFKRIIDPESEYLSIEELDNGDVEKVLGWSQDFLLYREDAASRMFEYRTDQKISEAGDLFARIARAYSWKGDPSVFRRMLLPTAHEARFWDVFNYVSTATKTCGADSFTTKTAEKTRDIVVASGLPTKAAHKVAQIAIRLEADEFFWTAEQTNAAIFQMKIGSQSSHQSFEKAVFAVLSSNKAKQLFSQQHMFDGDDQLQRFADEYTHAVHQQVSPPKFSFPRLQNYLLRCQHRLWHDFVAAHTNDMVVEAGGENPVEAFQTPFAAVMISHWRAIKYFYMKDSYDEETKRALFDKSILVLFQNLYDVRYGLSILGNAFATQEAPKFSNHTKHRSYDPFHDLSDLENLLNPVEDYPHVRQDWAAAVVDLMELMKPDLESARSAANAIEAYCVRNEMEDSRAVVRLMVRHVSGGKVATADDLKAALGSVENDVKKVMEDYFFPDTSSAVQALENQRGNIQGFNASQFLDYTKMKYSDESFETKTAQKTMVLVERFKCPVKSAYAIAKIVIGLEVANFWNPAATHTVFEKMEASLPPALRGDDEIDIMQLFKNASEKFPTEREQEMMDLDFELQRVADEHKNAATKKTFLRTFTIPHLRYYLERCQRRLWLEFLNHPVPSKVEDVVVMVYQSNSEHHVADRLLSHWNKINKYLAWAYKRSTTDIGLSSLVMDTMQNIKEHGRYQRLLSGHVITANHFSVDAKPPSFADLDYFTLIFNVLWFSRQGNADDPNDLEAMRQQSFDDFQAMLDKFGGCATTDEIRKKYRKLALKYHPDRKGGSKEEFQALDAAQKVANTMLAPKAEAQAESFEEKTRKATIKKIMDSLEIKKNQMQRGDTNILSADLIQGFYKITVQGSSIHQRLLFTHEVGFPAYIQLATGLGASGARAMASDFPMDRIELVDAPTDEASHFLQYKTKLPEKSGPYLLNAPERLTDFYEGKRNYRLVAFQEAGDGRVFSASKELDEYNRVINEPFEPRDGLREKQDSWYDDADTKLEKHYDAVHAMYEALKDQGDVTLWLVPQSLRMIDKELNSGERELLNYVDQATMTMSLMLTNSEQNAMLEK